MGIAIGFNRVAMKYRLLSAFYIDDLSSHVGANGVLMNSASHGIDLKLSAHVYEKLAITLDLPTAAGHGREWSGKN
jgi:hypothetical protein